MQLNKIDEVSNSVNRLLSDFIGLLSSKSFATMATWRNDFSSLLLTSEQDYTKTFCKFLYAHQVTFRPKLPKWDQNLQFPRRDDEHPCHFYTGDPPYLN